MSSRNCCTALPRAYTPDQQPSRAVQLPPAALDGVVTTTTDEPGSRYTSARTEDLQEIRQLFNDANDVLSNSVGIIRRKSRDLHHAYTTKHPSVGELFPKIRNKLSRKSRSKSLNMASFLEQAQLQQAKSELRNTLTSNRGPDSGGYDEDAPELGDVEASITPLDGAVGSVRGRSRHQSMDAQIMLGSGETNHHSGPPRRSTSLSALHLSSESHQLRRSWSDSSLAGGANLKLPQIRLPSFEAASNSKTWKQAVMHSLQISPSIQNFSEADATGKELTPAKENTLRVDTLQSVPLQRLPSISHTGFLKNSFDHNWAFSHSAKPSATNHKPLDGRLPEPGRTTRSASEVSMHLQNMRISQHLRSPSQFSHAHFVSGTHTAMASAATSRPDTPENDISSSPPEISVLHQTSPVESIERRPTTVQRKPTPIQRKATPLQRALSQVSQLSRSSTTLLPAKFARQERKASESGFSTDDVPGEWGNVVRGDDAASSMYSTALESPALTPRPSVTYLPRPSVATIHEHHPESTVIVETSDENDPLAGTPRQSSSSGRSPVAPHGSMPENPSTSNLSDNSKSSKVSRFKEDFDTSMTKKSTKRNSLANLFTRARAKRRSTNIESFDGSIDDIPSEPKRLQRARLLSEQPDAAGLLAKAISKHHEEKSALFLDPSKVTPRDKIFRQRSASFIRPRGLSTGTTGSNTSGEGVASGTLPVPAVRYEGGHRRSTSENTFLKPEFGVPSFDDEPLGKGKAPARRSVSAGKLRPDFSTSIFSSSLSPEAHSNSPRLKPRLSIALDPMEITPSPPGSAGIRSRSPSFQLNDLPALMESQPPTPSIFDASRPTTGYISDTGAVDIDDPNLNLGAWSRYPSHTREQRTGSAGTTDKVKTRDFAYDINTLNILEEEDSSEDTPHVKHKRKGKKKARTGLPKSRSMMIGKEYIKNYVRLIRSPSVEWLHSGKGHRSSISAGGSVEHPELEVIPPVFFAVHPILEEEVEHDSSPFKQRRRDIELQDLSKPGRERGVSNVTTSGSVYDGSAEAETTAAENEPTRRAASSPDLTREMSGSRASDALSWSRVYESCVYLPRASQSMDRPRHPPDTSEDLSNVGSEIPLLIDSMLARSRASSVNTAPIIANATVPLVRKKSKYNHRNVGSVGSVSSIRASSMDLLKTLAEAEERERMKCLEMLTRQRSGATSRSVSHTVNVVEESVESSDEEEVYVDVETSTVTTYEVQAVAPVAVDMMDTVEASA